MLKLKYIATRKLYPHFRGAKLIEVAPLWQTPIKLYSKTLNITKLGFILVLFILFLNSKLNANEFSNHNIAKELKIASLKANIDKRVLYTIAKIESGFKPLIISFTSYKTNYNYTNLNKKVAKYKDKFIISFSGNEMDLKIALKDLIKKGLKVDAGLMQINSVNFNHNEIDSIFKLDYNIAKATKVLKSCIDLQANTKKALECYNKGSRKTYYSFDYYTNFKNHYIKDFT